MTPWWVQSSKNFLNPTIRPTKNGDNLSRWHQNVRACNPMQPNLLSVRKKFLLSGVSSEYKHLVKFAEDTDPYLIGEELEGSLKNSKRRHYSLQALNPKINYPHPSAKQKFHEIPKNGRPTKRPMAGHKGTPQYNSPSTWAELKKKSSGRSQCKNHHKDGRN